MIEDNQDNDYDTAFRMAIEALKAQHSHEGTTFDTISRQAAIDIFDDYNIAVENGELEAYSRDRKRLCNLPTIQPERAAGEWIVHLYKVGVSRYECDTCHARCDIIYPYCPYCGEKKEGERYAIN